MPFELCCRYLDFMEGHLAQACNYSLPAALKDELATAILHLEVSLACAPAPDVGSMLACTMSPCCAAFLHVLKLCTWR